MTAYIVERALAGMNARHRTTMQYALQEASRRVTSSGSPVRYLGSTFVPARSRCYCLFEADSIQIVKAVNDAALVPYLSINEAIDLRVKAQSPTKEAGSGVA